MPPLDIRQQRVIIAVFAMPNCPACEEFKPRLESAVTKRGAPFVLWNGGRLRPGRIPVFLYDVTSNDPQLQALADRFQITSTPTTMVLRQPSGAFRAEGALSERQIEALLDIAEQYNV